MRPLFFLCKRLDDTRHNLLHDILKHPSQHREISSGILLSPLPSFLFSKLSVFIGFPSFDHRTKTRSGFNSLHRHQFFVPPSPGFLYPFLMSLASISLNFLISSCGGTGFEIKSNPSSKISFPCITFEG